MLHDSMMMKAEGNPLHKFNRILFRISLKLTTMKYES